MKPIEVKNVFKFEEDEDGNGYVETEQSVISRIRYQFGFSHSKIVPLEGSFDSFEALGIKHSYYNKISFSVAGYGYGTDFKDIWRDEAYDDPKSTTAIIQKSRTMPKKEYLLTQQDKETINTFDKHTTRYFRGEDKVPCN